MGSPYNTDSSMISFTSIATGSVIVGGVINIQSSNPQSYLDKATTQIKASGGYNGFSLVSSAFVGVGFTAATSNVNLPLILGISIPLSVIFIIVIVVVVVKVVKKNNDVREIVKL